MEYESGGDEDAAAHRLLIGAIICASPGSRDRVFEMLAPGDLDTPLAADALEILRSLHQDGVIDPTALTEQFADTVYARQKAPRRPGAGIPARYPCGPITWLANAFCDAARLDNFGAVILAMPWSGTGRRRALAHAAGLLADVARSSEYDDDDIAAVAEKLLPLLEVNS